jgi:hypothetical protein
MTATEAAIHAAPDELLALARAVRPAWDHDILAAAVLAAKNSGWTWDRTLAETVRLMRDPDGSPWDLKRAAADPFERRHPRTLPDADSPGVSAYREARLELEHQLIEDGAMDDEAISAHMRRGSEHNRILRGGGAP